MAKVMAVRTMGRPTRAMAASYDPEGLFANKARVKTKLGAMDRPKWLRELKKVPEEACDASGGAPVVALDPEVKEELAKLLAEEYLPVDLDAPGVKVHHLDPPVITVDGFLTPQECDLFVEETLRSETLKRSTVGEGNLDSERNQQSETRTSRSVLLNEEVQTEHRGLKDLARKLQTRAKQVFAVERWSPTGILPGPNQVCFEALQVAVYQEEDAVDEKWVCQQWIARGMPVDGLSAQNGSSPAQEVQGELFRQVKKGKTKAAKGRKSAASRGFGAR